jgi:hypothetical protein
MLPKYRRGVKGKLSEGKKRKEGKRGKGGILTSTAIEAADLS